MSLVIAIKDKDRIVLGADRQSSVGGTKDHTSTKIWPVRDLPGALMGSVGSARASQVIQYSNVIDKNVLSKEITTEYIICVISPLIAASLKSNGVAVNNPDGGICDIMPNTFIFAYKDKAWMIWNDFSVSEITDYLAIGSGSDIAKGALFATQDKNPFERIVTGIDAAAINTLYVDNEIDLLATAVKPSDEKQINAALGIPQPIKETKETKKATKPTNKSAKAKK